MTTSAEKHLCETCHAELEPLNLPGRDVPIFGRFCDPCIEIQRVENRMAEEKREQAAFQAEDRNLFGSMAYENFTMPKLKEHSGNSEARLFFATRWSPARNNAYLHGPCGTGKSHLAIGTYRLCPTRRYERNTGFLTWPSLNRRFRALKADVELERLKETAACSPLLIDDLAAGRSSEFTCDIFLQILNIRIQEGINGLIVTSNLSLADLANKLQDDRIASRLSGMCSVFKMDGLDRRLGMSGQSPFAMVSP